MVETVAAKVWRNAPERAQIETMPMLRFGQCKMLEVMKQLTKMNRRFLTMETGLFGMTLTPPLAGQRAAVNCCVRQAVAGRKNKSNKD